MNDSENLKIFPGIDNLYAVMFYNHDKLSEAKIKEDFEKFGIIVNLRILESGVGFIRYREHSEAIACLKEMSMNPNYLAKVPDTKKGQKYGGDKPPNGGGRNSYANNKFNRRSQGNDFNRNVGTQGNDFNRNGGQTKDEWNVASADESRTFDRSFVDSNNPVADNDEPPRLISCKGGAMKNNRVHGFQGNEPVPSLKPHANVAWERELSQLPEVPATEVIVANLPPGVFQSELYELCAAGEPLHIDCYSTDTQVEVHYASVYVKTLKHAHYLISELNGQYIENNRLVVALASTILKDCDNNSDG